MTELSKEKLEEKLETLLNDAIKEEKRGNWEDSIAILDKIKKICIDNNNEKLEAVVTYKLGEIYHISSHFEKVRGRILHNINLAIKNFQRALIIYRKLAFKSKIKACQGFLNFIQYVFGLEEEKSEYFIESANKHFKKAKTGFSKKRNKEEFYKLAILESRALSLIIGEKLIQVNTIPSIHKLILENRKLLTKIWNYIKNKDDFSEIYTYHFLKSIIDLSSWIIAYCPIDECDIKNYILDTIKDFEEILSIFKERNKKLLLFYGYTIYSYLNLSYARYFAENQFEQKKYLKTTQKWVSEAENILPSIKSNQILGIYYYTKYTTAFSLTSLGYFAKNFKKVLIDLNYCIATGSLSFPKISIAHILLDASSAFLDIAFSNFTPDKLRLDFVHNALDLINLPTDQLSLIHEPRYKIFNMNYKSQLVAANALLGDYSEDIDKKSNYIRIASRNFNDLMEYEYHNIDKTIFYYTKYLFYASRTGIILARNSKNKKDKIEYYQKTTIFLLKSLELVFAHSYIENLFLIGDTLFEVGKLTNDDQLLKKAYSSYIDAIEYCQNKGYQNLVGTAYINLAQIEDRLNNYISAAENYKKAIDSYERAVLHLSYTKSVKKIEKLMNYLKAWESIEIAKSHHLKEDHIKAQFFYAKASKILRNLREYKFEAPFYAAWGKLEEAEELSKQNKNKEAVKSYLEAKNNFEEAIETFQEFSKKHTHEDKKRISKLIEVAKVRVIYCEARYMIENARLEGKVGNHNAAAELYSKSGNLFEKLCQKFKIKREKDELTAIFHLCKAWENLERAEAQQDPSLYTIASDLFKDAEKIFPEVKMKKYSIANSQYCIALAFGILFDNSSDLKDKINYYRKIKMFLRDSARNYQLGGFGQDAQWALATSAFFDGLWFLIKSDNETDLPTKKEYMNIAIYYLESALSMFDKAGYEKKKEIILKYLDMLQTEKSALISALKIIEKPHLLKSSIGISAPNCPIEISSSVNVEEMQKTDFQAESENSWRERIHHIYYYLSDGACIFNQSFSTEKKVSPVLVAGGLTGIASLIQELTQTQTRVKVIEQENMSILLEHGKFVSAALISEENLVTLRTKLIQSVRNIEDVYRTELENYQGKISGFNKIRDIVNSIFGN